MTARGRGVPRRQARPIRPRADRTVTVDGRAFAVRIRGRAMPARSFGPRSDLFVGLLWSGPVWLNRRLTGRRDCTIGVYRLPPKGWVTWERRIRREHIATVDEAVVRADALVEALEDGSFSAEA